MRVIAILSLVLVGLCPVRGRGGEFATGHGVAIANGVAAVRFNTDSGFKVLLPHGPAVGLTEIQTTFTDGTTRRTSVLYAGSHALRTPFPVEMAEILGALSVLTLLLGLIGVLKVTLYNTRAELGASPNGGPVSSLTNSAGSGGPPSVS